MWQKVTFDKEEMNMTKQEFEALAKYEVSEQVFEAINTLYMNCELDKFQFVKKFGKQFKEFQVKKEEKLYKVMIGGTPNGCYFIVRYARLIDIDIASGYNLIEYISDEERVEKGLDIYSYDYDLLDYKCKEVRA